MPPKGIQAGLLLTIEGWSGIGWPRQSKLAGQPRSAGG